MALWKRVKSCLEDEKCRPTVIAGQGALEELQDSMSETERGERLGPLRRKGAPKKRGPSKDFGSEEVRDRGKDATGEKMKVKEKPPKGKSLYPVKELEALGLNNSDSNTGLSPSEREDLEDEAAHYEKERYHPDESTLRGFLNRLTPWFSPTGSLTLPSREKLRREIVREESEWEKKRMKISYFRALLGTEGKWETSCFLSGSYGDILSSG